MPRPAAGMTALRTWVMGRVLLAGLRRQRALLAATQPVEVVAVADRRRARRSAANADHLARRAVPTSQRAAAGSPTATATEPADAAPERPSPPPTHTTASTRVDTGQQHQRHPRAGGHALAAAEPPGHRARRGRAPPRARTPPRRRGCPVARPIAGGQRALGDVAEQDDGAGPPAHRAEGVGRPRVAGALLGGVAALAAARRGSRWGTCPAGRPAPRAATPGPRAPAYGRSGVRPAEGPPLRWHSPCSSASGGERCPPTTTGARPVARSSRCPVVHRRRPHHLRGLRRRAAQAVRRRRHRLQGQRLLQERQPGQVDEPRRPPAPTRAAATGRARATTARAATSRTRPRRASRTPPPPRSTAAPRQDATRPRRARPAPEPLPAPGGPTASVGRGFPRLIGSILEEARPCAGRPCPTASTWRWPCAAAPASARALVVGARGCCAALAVHDRRCSGPRTPPPPGASAVPVLVATERPRRRAIGSTPATRRVDHQPAPLVPDGALDRAARRRSAGRARLRRRGGPRGAAGARPGSSAVAARLPAGHAGDGDPGRARHDAAAGRSATASTCSWRSPPEAAGDGPPGLRARHRRARRRRQRRGRHDRRARRRRAAARGRLRRRAP